MAGRMISGQQRPEIGVRRDKDPLLGACPFENLPVGRRAEAVRTNMDGIVSGPPTRSPECATDCCRSGISRRATYQDFSDLQCLGGVVHAMPRTRPRGLGREARL